MTSRLPGFYRLGIAERRRRVLETSGIAEGRFASIDPGALPLEVADGMIENVIGTYALPFAIAVNFTVDGRDVGPILIAEGLAQQFQCGAISCPPRRPWC